MPAPLADPTPHTDLALILSAALAAGEIAQRHFGQNPQVWDKGNGQGPVSAADLEVNAMLLARLTKARPGYGWLSEETPDTPDRLTTRTQFIIDPIDGTRAFLDGQKTFAHAIAVVDYGQPIAAVVHLPLMHLTYTATKSGGAFLNGQPLQTPPRATLTQARILSNRTAFAPEHWPGGVPDIERHFRPSLAWRICLVAEGAFDGMITLRDTWEWDSAAATLIATEARASVTDRHGAALRFNQPHPQSPGLIAGPQGVVNGFLARLA